MANRRWELAQNLELTEHNIFHNRLYEYVSLKVTENSSRLNVFKAKITRNSYCFSLIPIDKNFTSNVQ